MVSLYEKQVENYAHADKSLQLVNKSSETSKSMLFLNFKNFIRVLYIVYSFDSSFGSLQHFLWVFQKTEIWW